jgi:hypothetical protein
MSAKSAAATAALFAAVRIIATASRQTTIVD